MKVIVGAYLSALVCVLLVAVILGFMSGLQHTGPPSAALLASLFTGSPWLDYWLLIQLLFTALWFSGTILKPYRLHITQFFLSSHQPTPDHTLLKKKEEMAEVLHQGSRFFVISLCFVIGLLGLTLAIVWVGSVHKGQDPAVTVNTYLALKQRENASLLNHQVGWLRTLLLVFVAPVVEELVFRGGLFAALRTRRGFWASAILSGVVFAVAHRQYTLNLPQVLLIGLSCAYAFEQTRSLRSSMVLHAGWNLLGVLVANPWIASILLLGGLIAWLWVRKPASASDRRTGWKRYTVTLTLVMLVGYALDSGVAWQAVMELPLLAALVLYAWKRSSGPPIFWRAYGVIYPLWIAFLLWVNSIPVSARSPWHQPFLSSEPIVTASGLAIEILGYALFMGPAFVVVWRLGLRRGVPAARQWSTEAAQIVPPS